MDLFLVCGGDENKDYSFDLWLGERWAETSLYNLVKYQSGKNDIEYTVISLGLNRSTFNGTVDYYKDRLEQEGARVVKVDICTTLLRVFA